MMTGLMGLMLAAAVLAPGGAPDMRVDAKGLSMGRTGDAAVLADRIQTASRDWCAQHRAVLTPGDLGLPQVCEREMRRRAYYRLPASERRLFVKAGGRRLLNQF
ncbi:MAG: UrcA family protein [Pseudomonadota bacterium]|nr:UrcA family protein [Pseudomonadota bacterium]